MTTRRSAAKKGIPEAVQWRTKSRILDYAAKECAGKFARIDVRFRGDQCYIDVYSAPEDVERNTPTHLCRLRYHGHADRWGFFFYTYAHEKYERSFLITGDHLGTPEEAFETATMFY